MADTRCSHGICLEDEMNAPEIDAWASAPISHPQIMSLQSLAQREVGLWALWPVVSFKPHRCDQYFHLQNTCVDFHTHLIPLHYTFNP